MPEAAPAAGGPFRFGAILLAAGGSSRMGSAKQLISVDGSPLVLRAVDAALGAGAQPVVVVLGAHAGKVREAIAGRPVVEALNAEWSSGLSSSIRAGLDAALASEPGLDAVLVTPVDQPALDSRTIAQLADLHRSSGLVACARYGGLNGAPAVFGRGHFAGLRALTGDQGARSLLNRDPGAVASLELPSLGIDIDTPADLLDWNRRKA
jgi:molybdenum cofactor cytidylyltransferase